MNETNKNFFWGVLLGAATAALTGAVALSRSFRSSKDGGGTWAPPAKKKKGSVPRLVQPAKAAVKKKTDASSRARSRADRAQQQRSSN